MSTLVRVPEPRRRGAIPKLPRPRGLSGVVRRAIPIDGAGRRFKKEIAETVRVFERRTMAHLRSEGFLGELARASDKYRERHGEKAPVGRSGRPLGAERARRILPVFETDEMKAVGRLFKADADDWRIELEAVLRDQYVRLYNIGGRGARLKLNVSGSFNLRNPFILDALEERANLISGISDSVYDRLRTVIAEEFYVFGNSPLDVAKTLEQEFTGLSRDRAELIARTETLAVTEEASHTVYESSGVAYQRWLTTLDGKERISHFEAHGQIVEIDQPFELDDEQEGPIELLFPGDPAGPISAIANCRCSTIPIVTEDQIISEAHVWRGDVDPDEFSKERIAEREEQAAVAAEKRVAAYAELARLQKEHRPMFSNDPGELMIRADEQDVVDFRELMARRACIFCGVSHRHGNKAGCPCPEPPGRPGPCACEGGGTAGGAEKPSGGRDFKGQVKALHEQAKKLDREITPAFSDAVANSGGQALGLDFRVKESLARAEEKLREKTAHEQLGEQSKPEEHLHDMLRYTVAWSPENYSAGRETFLAEMKAKGYNVYDSKDKNYWQSDVYKGENYAFQHPTGFTFEIQMHTGDSYRTKESNHRMYEELRRQGTSPERAKELVVRMRESWRNVQIPSGAMLRGRSTTG